MLGLALVSNRAAAQTAVEQAQILRDFERSVAEYTQRHQCLAMFPEALNAATPAPKIFTLPVAMVFRQTIARVLAGGDAAIGVSARLHIARWFYSRSRRTSSTISLRCSPMCYPVADDARYRLIGNDLVIRDTAADVIVAVLRDAIGNATTVRR